MVMSVGQANASFSVEKEGLCTRLLLRIYRRQATGNRPASMPLVYGTASTNPASTPPYPPPITPPKLTHHPRQALQASRVCGQAPLPGPIQRGSWGIPDAGQTRQGAMIVMAASDRRLDREPWRRIAFLPGSKCSVHNPQQRCQPDTLRILPCCSLTESTKRTPGRLDQAHPSTRATMIRW